VHKNSGQAAVKQETKKNNKSQGESKEGVVERSSLIQNFEIQ
jgi:hypothetical protein